MTEIYDSEEFGVIAPTLDEADDEETVMADHSGLEPWEVLDV